MTHYLIQFRYSQPAFKGLVDKPQNRTEAARKAFEGFGGKMHSFYMAFGEYDGIVVAEFPDSQSITASLMALGASGALAATKTTVLITAEEAESAMRKAHDTKSGYKPPQG